MHYVVLPVTRTFTPYICPEGSANHDIKFILTLQNVNVIVVLKVKSKVALKDSHQICHLKENRSKVNSPRTLVLKTSHLKNPLEPSDCVFNSAHRNVCRNHVFIHVFSH